MVKPRAEGEPAAGGRLGDSMCGSEWGQLLAVLALPLAQAHWGEKSEGRTRRSSIPTANGG